MLAQIPWGSRFGAETQLVIHFVPDPAKGVGEMIRVVRPGGLVAAYVWEALGGDPMEPIRTEMRTLGRTPAAPPSVHASRMEALHGLWTDAGLEGIETRAITVRRSFDSFDNFWKVSTATAGVRPTLDLMEADAIAELKERVRGRLPADGQARITFGACANAIRATCRSRRHREMRERHVTVLVGAVDHRIFTSYPSRPGN